MQLMRWSITRRLESRGEKQRRDAKICQPETPETADARLAALSRCSGEDNDSASDGEESAGGGALGDEAVDLTSARSHHEDELDEREEQLPVETPIVEDEDVDEQDEPDDSDAADSQQQPRPQKRLRDGEENEEGSCKRTRLCQDAENNNSFVEGGLPAGVFPPAGTSHVTLEALQNTKVAVAQFAATALAGGADSEAALQELAVLQSTLYTLQHQQVFQLQLISQLQQQLSITAQQAPTAGAALSEQTPGVVTGGPGSDSKETSPSPATATALIHPKPLSSLTSPAHSRPPSSHHQQQPSPSSTPIGPQERPTPSGSTSPLNVPLGSGSLPSGATITPPVTSVASSQMPHQMPGLCSISSSLASSIITNNDPLPLHEPNTLEMLQKRAQEVLDNASQGLLANNLADELAFRGAGGKGQRLSSYDGKGPGGRSEPFFKHRCRYCGKVFGSDSALQIHIRSHTGERPFKCNVCGSRFTTKGNLKVHFQRHRDKFPHVKMNPHPIPEHLDKYHPPLLQQLAACGQRPLSPPPPPPMPPQSSGPGVIGGPHPSPGAPPFHSPGAFLPPQPPLPLGLTLPGMPGALYRSPLLNSAAQQQQPPHREDQDMPENLSKPLSTSGNTAPTTPTHSVTHSPSPSPGAHSNSHHSFNEPCQKQQDEIVKTEHREQSPSRDYHQQPVRPSSRDDAPPSSEPIQLKNEPEDADETNEDDAEDFDVDPTRRYLNSSSPHLSAVNQPAMSAGHPQMYEDCSMDSKVSGRMEGEPGDMDNDEDMDDQPENLSSRANPASMLQQSMQVYPGASPASSSASSGSLQNSFSNIIFPGLPPHPQLAAVAHHASAQQAAAAAAAKQNAYCTGAPPSSELIDPSRDQTMEMMDPARDPAIYSNLLPRPGSNDNSWESLIEITKTSETSKLQQLVDNIEHKLTDPNQCIICQRVLSCKSALQMHYRTHTGERPFKCKICGRAFTTKGNLKTHMGVHRAKPPLRPLYQCTVCHKKFANSFVLQQHVKLHTNDPTELTPEQIRAAEVHDMPPAGYPQHPLAVFLPQGFPPMHPAGFPLGFPPTARQHALERQPIDHDGDSKDSLHLHQQQLQHHLQQQRYLEEHGNDDVEEVEDEEEDRREDDERNDESRERRSSFEGEDDKDLDQDQDLDTKDNIMTSSPSVMPTFSTSLAALESQVRTITTMATSMANNGQQPLPKSSPPPSMLRYNGSEKSNSPIGNNPVSAAPLDLTPRASSTPAPISSAPISPPNATALSNPQTHHPPHPFGMFAGLLQAVSTSPTAAAAAAAAAAGANAAAAAAAAAAAGANAVSPGPGMGPLASLTTSAVRAATSTYNPLGLAVGGSAVRGNTTCNICYKTFACNSALEIHYRSHTKERPFKCTICERGFSTKSVEEGGQTPTRAGIASGAPRCTCAERARRSAREKARRRRRAEERRRALGRSACLGDVAAARSRLAPMPPPASPTALGLLASDPSVFLGNMKQHMLTHKIRDMPHHLFDKAPNQQPPPPPQQQPQQPPPTSQQQLMPSNLHEHMQQQQQQQQQQQLQQRETSRSPVSADESNLSAPVSQPMPPSQPQQPPPPPPPPQPQQQQQVPVSLDAGMPTVKKMQENELPAPKRPPSMSSKHLCQVCNKNFSSSSALQIHMRTHTGDKPFQCTVCQKAFTTKGNLKVHMGTHMWTNGASRRGRRMSLDIPSLPITPKDSEFLQRRPDLFYPYLPAPFLNGVPQKLNEISVIHGSNGLPIPSNHPSKYAGLFGSVYAAAGFPSHLVDKQQHQQQHQQSMSPPLTNGPIDMMSPKSLGPGAGSLLFQATSSPPSPAQSPGNQTSPWQSAAEMMHLQQQQQQQRQQMYEREAAVLAAAAAAAAQRPESDGSPPARLPPPPPAPRGEGLAA